MGVKKTKPDQLRGCQLLTKGAKIFINVGSAAVFRNAMTL